MKMIKSFVAAALAVALPLINAQATPEQVASGNPIPGNYTGPLRPQVHFSPPAGFMNDPNGMFQDANGTWHLYYQYNPTATVAGNQHWGHASSQDLYTWINQPIALAPINESCYIFSGSAVVDVNNTSGFFPDQDNGVVAIFTIATYAPILLQTQGLAYSKDGGYTFEMYANNPVLDIGSSQFRDPYVIWYEDHWAMVIAYAQEYTIGIYTSPDLKSWTHASNFSHHGLLGLQYECPNLVKVPVDGTDDSKYLLQISINPGAPLGGSIAEYFLGDFDGQTFTTLDDATRISDFGKDAYAGQFFHGTDPNEAVVMNWASNWQYTQQVPTGPQEGWRSAMSVPHSVSVREIPRIGWIQVTRPYDLSPVLGDTLVQKTMGNGSLALDFSDVSSNALHVFINVTNIPTANLTGSMNFTFSSPISGEYLQCASFFGGDPAFAINRGNVRGFDNIYFTDKFSSSQVLGTTWSVEAILDRSVLETFLDDGAYTGSTVFYPIEALTVMTFGVEGLPPGNMTVDVTVTGLKSTWEAQENEAGTVLGNVTAPSYPSNGTYAKRHGRVAYVPSF
ncbi:hypothetical protein FH972_024394 [Carpinus fangiana]|uniref:Glycosyl hydrolase family 32 N-terminal domain-containing protein n=1 Tax=Carpinus fangiana TaxID=176857 RepID=A0A5N6KYB8_9ROSI|nr:hypothetical protein FH972_024394 [Carpinus fangiana]